MEPAAARALKRLRDPEQEQLNALALLVVERLLQKFLKRKFYSLLTGWKRVLSVLSLKLLLRLVKPFGLLTDLS